MSPEGRTSRQQAGITKRRRTRQRILDAARSLFDERGYYGVTIEEISREAGISVATSFNHFPTKQDIAIAVYTPLVLELMQSIENSIVDGRQIDDVIAEFVHGLAGGLYAHPGMAYVLLPLTHDRRMTKHSESDEAAPDVSLWQLAEFLGRLLEQRERADQRYVPAVEVASFHLSGLLAWIVQHPERSGEDAATLALSQLL